jgi:hypothetical protein
MRFLKKCLPILLYGCLLLTGLLMLAPVGFRLWLRYEYDLPSEELVRKQFKDDRADYIQFVTLLQRDQSIHFIDDGGRVDGPHARVIPEYQQLIRKIRAKFVIVQQDGSIEFSLYGMGCAICSDSYMGIRYVPKDRRPGDSAEWGHTVASLKSAQLPHEHGTVAAGLYVVPIEAEWFVYRLEYQE